MGVPVIKNLKEKRLLTINAWVKSEERVDVNFPNTTAFIIRQMIETYEQERGSSMVRIPLLASLYQQIEHRGLF
jgi:hypothetical protein